MRSRMHHTTSRFLSVTILAMLAALDCSVSRAQAVISDSFTGTTTTNQWLFFYGACLTAGSTSVTGSIGQSTTDSNGNAAYTFPGCIGIASSFYGEDLVGGVDGYLGSSSAPSSPANGTPDPSGQGALRFTNGHPGGYAQHGSIVSASTYPTNSGIQIQFETLTYRGDSGGYIGDGADGMSFYLMDGCMPVTGGTLPSGCSANPIYGTTSDTSGVTTTETFPGIGAWGGSLAYTCSNANPPYDGLVGAYIGLGIDEYGNFLNGADNTLNEASLWTSGDNTASGGGYQPGRIGLRGAGAVSWQALNSAYGTDQGPTLPYYPAGLETACGVSGNTYTGGTLGNACSGSPTDAAYAVQRTCSSGSLYNYWNYSNGTLHHNHPTEITAATLSNALNPAGILDYTAIPNAYSVLSQQIASESAQTRTLCPAGQQTNQGCVTPIVYNLTITQSGLLSLSFSYNGGATQQVIKEQDITTSNGPLPSSFRFGFAGSTGGSTNIHEILCFKAQPNTLSASSAGVNQLQSQEYQTGTTAYFAFYDPMNWTGRLTANPLVVSNGVLSVDPTPLWDASCMLTGGTCASTGGTVAAQGPTSRTMLTWNGSQGTPFEWSNLTSAQQSALDSGDPSSESEPGNRLNWLRGDRTNEVNTASTCPQAALAPSQTCFRVRDDVLGDIVDSSPTWVGPPLSPYTGAWSDKLYSSATSAENTGTQSYVQFVSAEETRQDVVYVGSNDGFLHGFRAGAYNQNGTFNPSAPNDGLEVLAYIPAASIQGSVLSVTSGSSTTSTSTVDTVHGTNPTSTPANAVTGNLDLPNPQYGHNFFADATPGTGDLFYQGMWHTWVVSGMGPGGAAIYALDVTNPGGASGGNFAESNAASLVMGEWSAGTITCQNVATCGQSLGNTYGTPVIRRTHAQDATGVGEWAVIWGNGLGSNSGDAGIFVMLIDPGAATGSGIPAQTIYYISTNQPAGSNDGITYVTPVDLDGDRVTDYVYAGDVNGNVWRFDLTSSNPQNWSTTRCLDAACQYTTTAPLFTTSSGQPITTQLVVAAGQTPVGRETVMIAFGTGQQFPFTNTTPASFATGTQSIYAVWDWAMANWNSKSSAQYAALTYPASGPATLTPANLAAQTYTVNNTGCGSTGTSSASCGDRDLSESAPVCWQGTSTSGCSSDNQFGWYANLPGGTASLPEQIIFNPVLVGGAFVVNSTIPPANALLSCTTASETGYTYGVQILTGAALTNAFPQYYDTSAVGVSTNASGTPLVVQTGNGQDWLVSQTYTPPSNTAPSGAASSGSSNGSGSQSSGVGVVTQFNAPNNNQGHRVTWIQLR
jgi:type IV pilus assembly protein PilY1